MKNSPFKSFWMGGYECADHLNEHGDRVNLLAATAHLEQIDQDYLLLKDFNIQTAREGIRWSVVEKRPYQYDWSDVGYMIDKGLQHGIQQIWDICHFGFPDDLTPFHPHFCRRFTSLCCSFVRFYRTFDPQGTLIITPINEISFLSWLGGDVGGTVPFCRGQGWETKYHLVKACIQAIKAMKEMDNNLLIMTTEPLVQIVPPLYAMEEELEATAFQHELQYQAIDMLYGRICPELGGSAELLDILGFNFYYNNQWILGYREFLPWANETNDFRWRPLSSLLAEVYERYELPIALTETSHPGIHRPEWLTFISDQCRIAINQGIPFLGICLYPIIDRPDWNQLSCWHHSGLWDHYPENNTHDVQRILHIPYADALLQAQKLIKNITLPAIHESQVVSGAFLS